MAADDAVAIVGVGCRFPGADSLDEFWRVLLNGENHVVDIPLERWKNAAFYDPDKTKHAKLYTTKAGLLRSYQEWDHRFFGISEVEASRMDPQQKFVLDCVHMAMEDGGITKTELDNTQTGVYMGCMNSDYGEITGRDHLEDSSYDVTGMATSIVAARVSYTYNLLGPSMRIDTACSSALVAIHVAIQAIKTGDCEQAICGGVNLLLLPDMFMSLCKAGMMSEVSQCQAFSDSADGYARGEGCGIVIIKPLKKALADGNKVWATIVTGSNQDGHMARPITAPSGLQQEKLLQKVYKESSIDPTEVQYIEAHGTGTPIGDPIEANCLGTFFSEQRKVSKYHDKPLLIGSVKTNIGHLESAAGVAGLIKVLLMMEHGIIVPSLHIDKGSPNINPKINLQNNNMHIPLETVPWEKNERNERVACVNSFGFGGSNGHAIVRQLMQKQQKTVKNDGETEHCNIICLSAIDKISLKQTIDFVDKNFQSSGERLQALAYTSCCRRDHYKYRVAIQAKNDTELRQQCQKKAQMLDKMKPPIKKRVIFVFCGVGTTWRGMCQELMKSIPEFRDSIRRVDVHLQALSGWKIEEKFSSNAEYTDPFVNHIAIFACQVGLTDMWRNFGVLPDAVVGQSVGEVAAAYASGVLPLKEAVKVIYHRSKALAAETGGKMLVVGNIDIDVVEEMCKATKGVSIAVYSSPTSCAISGDSDAVDQISNELKQNADEKGIQILLREIPVKCAYHSHRVESSMTAIEKTLSTLEKGTPSSEHISSVTGEKATPNDFLTGAYWASNVRRPVLFMHAIRKAAASRQKNLYVEIGPKQVLKAHLSSIFGQSEDVSFPSMNSGNEVSIMQSTLMSLYEEGLNIKWDKYYTDKTEYAKLPKYQFNRQSVLHVSDKLKQYLQGRSTQEAHFHMFVAEAFGHNTEFRLLISKTQTAFVFDHLHNGAVLVPGVTYAEVGFAIASRLLSSPAYSFDVSLTFRSTFSLSTGSESQAGIHVEQMKTSDSLHFTVRKDNILFAEGTVTKRTRKEHGQIDLEKIKKRCNKMRTKRENYSCLEAIGFTYGEAMSVLGMSWTRGQECLAEIVLPSPVKHELSRTHLHPAILDGVLQVAGTFIDNEGSGATFPQGIGHVTINRPPTDYMYAYVNRLYRTQDEDHFSALLLTEDGNVVAELENFHTKTIQEQQSNHSEKVYQLAWSELKTNSRMSTSELPQRSDETVVVFHLGNKLVHLEKLAKSDSFLTVDLQQKGSGSDDKIETTLTSVGSKSPKCIIFAPGKLDGDPESHTEKEIYERAKATFSSMATLIKGVSQRTMTVPLLVVTEDSQISQTSKPTIYCSELWGMVRSAVREFINQDITLIDVQSNSENQEVFSMLSSNLDVFKQHAEFVVSEGKLFVSRFIVHPSQSHIPLLKKVHNDNDANCILMSSNNNEVNQPTWRVCTRSNRNQNVSSAIELHMGWYCEHQKGLFPVTEESDHLGQDLWPETREDGYAMLALEGGGHRGSDNKTSYVFCYPVQISRIVSVPESCTFRETELPLYFPGILKCAVVTWKLAKMVQPGREALIVTESLDCRFGILLADALRGKVKAKHKTVSKHELLEQTETIAKQISCDTLILLTRFDKAEAKHILSLLKRATLVVSIRQCIDISTERYLDQSFDISTEVIEPENLFKRHSLESLMPEVRGWLTLVHKDTINAIAELSKSAIELQDSVLPCVFPQTRISIKGHSSSTEMKVTKSDLFRANGCYVIVGGLTGLGWELLVFMAEQGAGVLATMTRRKPTASQVEMIQTAESRFHCKIICIQADITDVNALQKGFSRLASKLNGIPVRGIFHGGGVLADSMLANMTNEQIDTALKPKILGAWNLHKASKELPLDFFVLHSSVTAIFGGAGQCNYAAGNSFLDSLAHYRRAHNLCGQSINWGALSLGMAARDAVTVRNLERQGVELLSVDDIKKFFLHALMLDEVQVTYGAFNWNVMLATKQLHFLEKFRNMVNFDSFTDEVKTIDVAEFNALSGEEQRTMLFALVKTAVAKVFVIEEELLLPDSTLFSLGADSMQLMSFVSAVFELTECRLPITSLMSEETAIEDVVDMLLQQLANTTSISRRTAMQDAETQNTFDRPLTFMQEIVLQECQNGLKSYEQLMLIDTELKGLVLRIEDWKAVFQAVLEREPALRTLFIQSGSTVLPLTDTNVDCCEIPFNDIESEEEDYDHRQKYAIDITKECPLKVRIGMTHEVTVIRIVIHKVVADYEAVSMLCNRVLQIALSNKQGHDLPPFDPDFDAQEVISSKLEPQMEIMRNYWMHEIPADLEPLSLRKTLPNELSGSFTVCNGEVPATVAKSIVSFTEKSGTTVFQFITSMYQLLLYKISKQNLFALTISADVRTHMPELSSTITRTMNKIPLIADFREKCKAREFLALTAARIEAGRQNGAYPFQRILTDIISEQTRDNIGRHNVEMLVLSKELSESHTASVKTFLFSQTNCDTELTIIQDETKKSLSLRYGFNSNMVEECDGVQMISQLVILMRLALKKPKASVTELTSDNPKKTQTDIRRNKGEETKAKGYSNLSTTCTIV